MWNPWCLHPWAFCNTGSLIRLTPLYDFWLVGDTDTTLCWRDRQLCVAKFNRIAQSWHFLTVFSSGCKIWWLSRRCPFICFQDIFFKPLLGWTSGTNSQHDARFAPHLLNPLLSRHENSSLVSVFSVGANACLLITRPPLNLHPENEAFMLSVEDSLVLFNWFYCV